MHLLYSFCFTLGFLLALPYFLLRAFWQKKYLSNFKQRLGWLPPAVDASAQGGVWIHAVSVGEVVAILPLARALQQKWPERPLFISTTTSTGQNLANQKLAGVARALYFPFDWRFSVRRSLNRVRPEIVLIAETEIWPNFLRECQLRRIPVLLINGRISDQSLLWYRKIRWFMKRTLAYFSYCCMQSQIDLERIRSLGAAWEKTEVCGNLKYEMHSPCGTEEKVEDYRRLLGLKDSSFFVVVAGSTMKDEERLVLSAFQELRRNSPQAVLLLAPRHPERFKEVEQLLRERSFHFIRRSTLSANDHSGLSRAPDVILLDTMGELAILYALADVVFIGGSLVPRGGHNLLEPAFFKKAILFGPSMSNFREMAEHFVRKKAAVQVEDESTLAKKFLELCQDSALRQQIGQNGYQILTAHRGATERIMNRIEALLSESHPSAP
jgi:3-deoxy-D-manno-octulosonic-acid transferase